MLDQELNKLYTLKLPSKKQRPLYAHKMLFYKQGMNKTDNLKNLKSIIVDTTHLTMTCDVNFRF